MRRVAVVHDWLVNYTGSERVLEQILACYPEADLFSLVDYIPEEQRGFLQGRRVHTSFLQALPFGRSLYQKFLPLMPAAIEHLDLRRYSLVLTSSSAIAKGVLTEPNQLHVCYVQSRNLRYGYDERFLYAAPGVWGPIQELMMSRARVWDYLAARRPTHTIANSQFVSRWHEHRYGVEASVIYPPVNLDLFGGAFRDSKDEYYILVSRFEKYKQVPLVIEAFNQLEKRLVVVGGGSQDKAVRRRAEANIEFLGVLPPDGVAQAVAGARAFVFAGREDFGIAFVEAQAAGTPVVTYGGGGANEVIRGLDCEVPTGVLFPDQTVECVVDGVLKFEGNSKRFSFAACRDNAARFSTERFRREYKDFVEQKWEAFTTRE